MRAEERLPRQRWEINVVNSLAWRALRTSVKSAVPRKYHRRARRAIALMATPVYLGNRVVCPCCGWRFRKFLPAGSTGRPNAHCPRCGSLERERLLHLYLRERTTLLTDNASVLHVAPEPALQKLMQSLPNIQYVSGDLESPLAMVKMDVTAIPYEDNRFDCVVCMHVLEHVVDDGKAMREIARVLKPDGFAILQVPIDLTRAKTFEDPTIVTPAARARAFGQEDHVRVYGRDYAARLEAAGFGVQVDDFATEIGADRRWRYGLVEDGIYYCSLPGHAEARG